MIPTRASKENQQRLNNTAINSCNNRSLAKPANGSNGAVSFASTIARSGVQSITEFLTHHCKIMVTGKSQNWILYSNKDAFWTVVSN